MTTWSPTQIAREREATMQPPHIYYIRRPIRAEREREREVDLEDRRGVAGTAWPPTQRDRERERGRPLRTLLTLILQGDPERQRERERESRHSEA